MRSLAAGTGGFERLAQVQQGIGAHERIRGVPLAASRPHR